ncbi:metallophosphoesterase [Segatella maculosa]|uniref:metallophosphoesterase n=1 Tax=Segatella maculosa TaxID=439703 RepID=UPI0023F4151E|nr:metallophosphoesterase [Segatella maculosa]
MNLFWAALFLLLPVAGQYYVSVRVWQLLPAIPLLRTSIVVLMALSFIGFFVAMSGLLDKLPLGLASFIYEVGTSWLVILLYMVMLFAVLDLGAAVGIIPRSFLKTSVLGSISVTLLLTVLFTYAYFHYDNKQRVELTLTSKGKLSRNMTLVMVSDLHLGYHNRRSDLHRWLERIKNERPDAILIAGDLIDRTIKPVDEEHSAEEFRRLGIPIFAVLGNHDYYTGVNVDKVFCQQAGIQLLQDSVAYFKDIAIVGRDDRTNKRRKPLNRLMEGIDRRKYIVELDHQPYHLEEAALNGVDFQLAGHTHYGQVWPINWITKAVYEDAFGPLTKGNTRYYVSSGLGIWGAKFRIGTQSEYIVAKIR